MTLNINNLGAVWEALYDARSKAYNIGLKLEVPVGTLDSIMKQYSDPSEQLRETLKAWLKMATPRKWQTIVQTLRSRIISEPTLANSIEAEYCGQATPRHVQASDQQRYTHVHVQQLQAKDQSEQQRYTHVHVQQLQAKDQQVQQLQRQIMELKSQLQSSTQSRETTDFPKRELQEVQRASEAVQTQRELKQRSTKQPSDQPQPNPQQETTPRMLIWRDSPKAPQIMTRGSLATDGNTVYCNRYNSQDIHQYQSDSKQWSTLPNFLPHAMATLVMAESKLTSVGGYRGPNEATATDSLLSLMGEGRDMKWLQHFPPMITKKYLAAAICHDCFLIVAGGYDHHNTLATVEVLNMGTHLWSIASSLPYPFCDATTSICGERLYILGGWDENGYWTRSVFTCSISKLLHSQNQYSTIWQRVTDAPYKASSGVALCGQLVAVGGEDEDEEDTKAVSAYDESTNFWLPIEAMKTPRSWALVASLHNNTMMVIGGYHGGRLDSVEIAKVKS